MSTSLGEQPLSGVERAFAIVETNSLNREQARAAQEVLNFDLGQNGGMEQDLKRIFNLAGMNNDLEEFMNANTGGLLKDKLESLRIGLRNMAQNLSVSKNPETQYKKTLCQALTRKISEMENFNYEDHSTAA